MQKIHYDGHGWVVVVQTISRSDCGVRRAASSFLIRKRLARRFLILLLKTKSTASSPERGRRRFSAQSARISAAAALCRSARADGAMRIQEPIVWGQH